MNKTLANWQSSGNYILFSIYNHRIFCKEYGDSTAEVKDTLLIIHGFPESSISFKDVIEGLLSRFRRIIIFDLLGFGLSDKPLDNFQYSVLQHADITLTVWKHFNIKGGHILSHDMGNSIANELLARKELDVLPAWFSEGIQSLTFTNGSVVMALAKLRITQKILLSRYNVLVRNLIFYKLFAHQVRSANGNNNISDENMRLMWEANKYNDGHKKAYRTINYINDRYRYESSRWIPALRSSEIPFHICWGIDDQVASVDIAVYLKDHVSKKSTISKMKAVGHFGHIGNPEVWLRNILAFYKKL